MKNIRFDLELFGESSEGCAAEQSQSTAEGNSVGIGSENTDTVTAEESKTGDVDAISRIGKLFGVDNGSEDEIVEYINKRRARASIDEMLRERRAMKAYGELISEADGLSSKIKDFDLVRELSDPRFRGMIRAGLTVEEAWRAVHAEELLEQAREIAKNEAVAKALEILRRSAIRPDENGGTGKAPSSSQRSVDSLTGRGIRDILRRVENGAKIKF